MTAANVPMRVAVVVDVIVPPEQAVAHLTHRIAYELPADAPARTALETFAVEGPALAVSPQPQIVVAPPLRGPGWEAANGCCLPTVHRSIRISDGTAMTKAETFAVDWIRLQDGAVFSGDGAQNEDWSAYGAGVYSVAAGTVISARNDMPDEIPFQAPQHVKSPGDYAGNHVMLEIGPGVYAFSAHFVPDSVMVAEGDTVETGDVIGQLGNTGIPDPQTDTLQLVYTVADFGE